VQAFVLVASAQPLPSYDEWRSRRGAIPWDRDQTDGVWVFDRERVNRVDVDRSGERERNREGKALGVLAFDPGADLAGVPWVALARYFPITTPRRLSDLRAFFKQRPEFDGVQGLAFPVKPK
jgi:hypothetical protein